MEVKLSVTESVLSLIPATLHPFWKVHGWLYVSTKISITEDSSSDLPLYGPSHCQLKC